MPSPCPSSTLDRLGSLTHDLSSKEVDDIVYEVDCSLITVKAGADVDIGAYPVDLPEDTRVLNWLAHRRQPLCRGWR